MGITTQSKSRSGSNSNEVRVDLEVIVIKGYSTLHRAPEQEPHYQMHFSVMPRMLNIKGCKLSTIYLSCQDGLQFF